MDDKATEWDEDKNTLNKKKHSSLSFVEASEVFDDCFAYEKYDKNQSSSEEDRFIVIGRIKNQVVIVVVYTQRNGKKRIISARHATGEERRFYYERLRQNN